MQGRAKVYTITQAVLCGLGLISSIPSALILFVIALLSFSSPSQDMMQGNLFLVYAFTLVFISLAFIPGLITAIYRLINKPIPKIPVPWKTPLLISGLVLWVASLVLSLLINQWKSFSILNAFLVLPLVIIPLILIVLLGARKLSIGNSTRTWGAVAFNFSITMPVVLTVEIILFILLVILMIVWLNRQPLLLNQILSLSNMFSQENIDPQAAEAIFTDLFAHPIVLNVSILVISLLVPLIEEFLKPMALWFLAGKKLTPAQGFIGGLIAGACFAAIETMGSIGAPVDNSWYMILFGRIGTGLLHITLSGLVGWGIASAFYNRNWGRAIFNYFGAVLIHGTWNLFALLSGILPILPSQEEFSSLLLVLSQIGPYLLVVIAVLNVFILIRANRKLQFESSQTSPLPAQI